MLRQRNNVWYRDVGWGFVGLTPSPLAASPACTQPTQRDTRRSPRQPYGEPCNGLLFHTQQAHGPRQHGNASVIHATAGGASRQPSLSLSIFRFLIFGFGKGCKPQRPSARKRDHTATLPQSLHVGRSGPQTLQPGIEPTFTVSAHQGHHTARRSLINDQAPHVTASPTHRQAPYSRSHRQALRVCCSSRQCHARHHRRQTCWCQHVIRTGAA